MIEFFPFSIWFYIDMFFNPNHYNTTNNVFLSTCLYNNYNDDFILCKIDHDATSIQPQILDIGKYKFLLLLIIDKYN